MSDPTGEDANPSARPTTPFNRPADASAPARIGQVLGDYELLQRIGRGGLGDVYRARHVPTGAVVALKLLRGGDEPSPSELRSFQREIAVARRLSHPGILPILDAGLLDGQLCCTMPLVTGGNLEKRLRAGQVDRRQGVAILAQVARAVHHAHQRRVLHRDLKPANILLDEQERPLVADFGLAKFLDQASGQTLTGQVMGTLPYMAPEQAAGHSRRSTPATDIWSLGVILYEMLTGQRPFQGDTHTEVLGRIQHDEPIPPRQVRNDIPAELEAICLRCLRKAPGRRYASAALLADDLERWLRSEKVEGSPAAEAMERPRYSPRRAIALLLVLLGGLLGAVVLLAPRPATTKASLESRLAQARPGKPVVLVDSRREPRWSKLAVGEQLSRRTSTTPAGQWLNTSGICLWELLPPDPNRKDFRLIVEMAHTDGNRHSRVGLYAGHTPHNQGQDILHTLIQAAYCDPLLADRDQPPRPRRNISLILACTVAIEPRGAPQRVHHIQLPLPAPFAMPLIPPGKDDQRVCTFCLDIRDTGWGMEVPPRQGGTWATRASLIDSLAMHRRLVPQTPANPELSPRGGAGIFVWRGSAVVLRVLYEPLAAP
jgi:serine/threonine-protein kinase